MKRDDIYYEALKTRDSRFDGKFFVGVKTTGIYCRPICPAKPKRGNVEFFSDAHAAEKAGYRPCLRCRPESAPQSAVWIGKSAVVRRAVKVLSSQDPLAFDEDRFADLFGVTARHLRRLFVDEIGKTPKQLAFDQRLNLARKLLVETSLPISEVAFGAGFRSIRRFNDAFKERFKKSPKEIRRSPMTKSGMKISLAYRPPFHFEGLMAVYESHRMGNIEWFENGKMHRIVEFGGKVGQVTIENDPENSRLLVEIDFPNTSVVHSIIARVRTLFDLDSDPVVIANSLELDPKTKALLKKHPGIRLPSGWDPFETAIAGILGQLVSVDRGRVLVGDLIELLGKESGLHVNGKNVKLFPSPETIANADLTSLKTTRVRKQTLIGFARVVADKTLSLDSTQDVDLFIKNLRMIKGVGPWTANNMALRVLRHTDAFPGTDLILARALEIHPQKIVDQMSPWRGYAAALYWKEYAGSLKKTSKEKSKKKMKK